MYRFNKEQLQDFAKISKMEFYMPNGLGGYVAGTVSNNLFKKHNNCNVIKTIKMTNR